MEHAKLKKAITYRKEFFEIEDPTEYKRVRVQLHARGVLLRDIVKGSKIKTKKQQACKEGDFIVAEIDAKVGGYGFIPGDLEGAIVSSHYYLFEVDESVLLPQFLHYCTQTPEFAAQLTAQGSTNYAAVRPHDVLDVSIPLPSLARQRELVSWLDAVTENIARKHQHLEQSAADLAVLRQRILHDAVQGKLTERDPDDEPASALLARIEAEKKRLYKAGEIRKPKTLPPVGEDEQPFELPEGWTWTRLLNTVAVVTDGDHQAPPKSDTGVPFVTITNLNSGRVHLPTGKFVPRAYFDELSEWRQPKENDVLLAVTASLGTVAMVQAGQEFCFQRHIGLIRSNGGIDPFYLRYVLESGFMLEAYDRIATGTAQKTIPLTGLRRLPVPLPPLTEQRRVVARVDELMVLCERLEAKLATAEEDAERLMRAVLEESLSLPAAVSS